MLLGVTLENLSGATSTIRRIEERIESKERELEAISGGLPRAVSFAV
jgi:hypothetical protein